MLSTFRVNKDFNGDCSRECMSEVTVKINGKEMELNPFTKNVVESTIKGLLGALRGYEEGDISITIKQ